MRRESFYAKTNRSGNLMHIETDGAIVNIQVGLTDEHGRAITRVDVLPDSEWRGGDGQGDIWHAEVGTHDDGRGWLKAGPPGYGAAVRVVRQLPPPKCGDKAVHGPHDWTMYRGPEVLSRTHCEGVV